MNFSIDVEADGPIPGEYSMTEFGIVVIDGKFEKTFHGRLRPISDNWDPEALAVSGKTREEVEEWDDPATVMLKAANFVREHCGGERAYFFSDNNGFDFMFWHWYCIKFLGDDPFGWTSVNIKNLFQGMQKDMRKNFKRLRKTKHTHHPVDDAKGNAEALWTMQTDYGLRLR